MPLDHLAGLRSLEGGDLRGRCQEAARIPPPPKAFDSDLLMGEDGRMEKIREQRQNVCCAESQRQAEQGRRQVCCGAPPVPPPDYPYGPAAYVTDTVETPVVRFLGISRPRMG